MNKRQIIILWIIALVLGAAVLIVKTNRKDPSKSHTDRTTGQTLFDSFPGAEIATVEVQGADSSVTLAKKDGKWTVAQRDGYPANTSNVNELIRTLTDLKITRAIEAGPSFAPRFGMDEAAANANERGLTATFKDASGKDLAKVSFGKNIESKPDAGPMEAGAVGRYIRNHADTSGFYGSTEMFPSLSTEPSRWLDDAFINPEKIKTITVSQPDKADPAWKVTREGEEAEFKLESAAADEVLDTTASSPLKTLFSYARFDDVVPADKLAGRAETAGKRAVTLETFEGFTYTITLTPAKAAAAAAPAAGTDTPPAGDKVLLAVDVSAELPKERKKEEGEKPEDAKTKDEAFTKRIKTLTEKLEKEKALAGRTFELPKTSVDALLKERAQMVTKPTPPPSLTPGGAAPGAGVQQLPGGLVVPPPPAAGPAKSLIEAVTPPIAVPPVDEQKDEKGK
jgi:Domain of unknown function (DUF4340)